MFSTIPLAYSTLQKTNSKTETGALPAMTDMLYAMAGNHLWKAGFLHTLDQSA